ncbi:glycosyltransferase [Asticcacaulis sp. DXS10W]|uniref:Glycosyltransferase n=1 Tax=Asticcacaulis currens TaxID=2984210 RepID=A0ABT5I985_9CAUL|nr:glycosyltransferase [Asticcacaulis currens]MDC7692748.1 glycosyltransferase [Asticcacaulis currens]
MVTICPAKETDFLEEAAHYTFPLTVVRGGVGASTQRNVIIRHATDTDLMVFLDDDYIADPDFLLEVERLFISQPDIVIATGDVIADGAQGIGITLDDAKRMVETLPPQPEEMLQNVFNGYGCNMIVRMSEARRHGILFDEALPLYSWWEDVDFSRRLAPFGRIVKSNRLRGVHMGSKSGRSPGQRLGYSQVANVVYMMQKGTVPLGVGTLRIARNVFANMTRQFIPEPWVDRRGRFVGNLKAIRDCLYSPADPRKCLEL